MAVRIVDGTFTPGEPTIVALRPGARDILDPALGAVCGYDGAEGIL